MDNFMDIMTIADGIVPICASIALLCFIVEKFNIQNRILKPADNIEKLIDGNSQPKDSPTTLGEIFLGAVEPDAFEEVESYIGVNKDDDVIDNGIDSFDDGADSFDDVDFFYDEVDFFFDDH
jgi:hypothetical protein